MGLHLKCKTTDAVAYQPAIEWAHIWDCYLVLNRTRQVGMAANPITFLEIEAFCRLTRVTLEPWEIEVLMEVDRLTLTHSSKTPGAPKTESASDGAAVKDLTSRIGRKRTIVAGPGDLKVPK